MSFDFLILSQRFLKSSGQSCSSTPLQRYRVRMIPVPPAKGGGGSLRVSARRVVTDSSMDEAPLPCADGSSPASASATGTAAPVTPAGASGEPKAALANNIVPTGGAGTGSGASAVASGLAQMFSSLQLNLQGIELSKPGLQVILPEVDTSAPGSGGDPVIAGAGDSSSSSGAGAMLEISMKMRIRSLPPLDMQF